MMKLSDKPCFNQFIEEAGSRILQKESSFSANSETLDFGYQTDASAVYSSNIEGNTVDLNSFMNFRLQKEIHREAKDLKEIDDLSKAYNFAQNNPLTEGSFLEAHRIFSEELLIKSLRGNYRNSKVGVFGSEGLVYMAVEEHLVPEIMSEFFAEISALLNEKLDAAEAFYFASLIHLRMAHIHPFLDGNGRAARLMEKWFLAEKLGKEFWKLPSEKFYKENRADYYKNISLGFDFYSVDYSKALPFLRMLPESLG